MVELGIALTPEGPSTLPGAQLGARMVQVQLVPDGRVVDARVAALGQGIGKGVFAPIQAADELIVLLPGGDANRAVVLGGLANGAAPNPLSNIGLGVLLQHPGGVELRSADGLPAEGIVMGPLVEDLAQYLTALEAFMLASSTATTAPQVAAAAVAFMAAVGQAPAAPSPFLAQLLASVLYVSTSHKVTV